jgi:GTP-sensing transcriptional pleiotropic repressor CodY
MPSSPLLEKIRKITNLLSVRGAAPGDLCALLSEWLETPVWLVTPQGRTYGAAPEAAPNLNIPITIAGTSLGTLFAYKNKGKFTTDDLILCEYGATVSALLLKGAAHEENSAEARQLKAIETTLATLSPPEKEALAQIFVELGDHEGVFVASKVADRTGLTRSTIVKALRKCESAGLIETRSSGMKGTYLKILPTPALLYAEVQKLRN